LRKGFGARKLRGTARTDGSINLSWSSREAGVRQTESSPDGIEYRELRRTDVPSFEKVVLQGTGRFERATGLEQLASSQLQPLERRSTWALLTLIRKVGNAIGVVPNLTFVAVSQGEVLGTASVILFPRTGYILGVVTDPSARRRGIATHLLEQTRLAAQRRGRSWLALDVESENEAAISLYEKLGFQEKARFSWYAGEPPATTATLVGAAKEVPESRMDNVISWVAHGQVPAIRDALPATRRRLSHFEIVTKPPGSPVKTWELSSSGQTLAVVRASYIPIIRTGYAIPASLDPGIPGDSLTSLMGPVTVWLRSLGAARMMVTLPEPADRWTPPLTALGLTKVVSTTFMLRRV
jgi:ribosomal protein S18 acetylase RimI-like enzyme